MILDNLWLVNLIPWLLFGFVLDCSFAGISLRLLGLGSWYKGLTEGEQVIYRNMLGCMRRNLGWNGIVVVTTQRLIIRLLWSRLALVDVPIESIHEVFPDKWWWFNTVRVIYRRGNRYRWIELGGTRKRVQIELIDAFRSAGVKVVEPSTASS